MTQFSLFDSPLELAHSFWIKHLTSSDIVIDATLGHGYDALKILPLIPHGFLYGLDIQKEAIASSLEKLSPLYTHFKLEQRSHETFPEEIAKGSVKLIVYNLGYLPGGNKSLTTQLASTQNSCTHALELLAPSGALSIMCYTGHPEGELEQKALLNWAQSLNKTDYLVSYHYLVNRNKAPALLFIQKNTKH